MIPEPGNSICDVDGDIVTAQLAVSGDVVLKYPCNLLNESACCEDCYVDAVYRREVARTAKSRA